jgi:uncharacterized protein YdeI (YjbR/CyaY-like superfamily)
MAGLVNPKSPIWKSVWLIIYKKKSPVPSVYYSKAVDEALWFGWIDSKANKRDDESYYQFFAKRNPKSNWSRVIKAKVEKLMAQNRMTPAGWALIQLAQQNGSWTALDKVEDILLSDDLQQAFNQDEAALAKWENFSRSTKRGILEWILNAKRPETRQKRIIETVTLAAKNQKANRFHP